MAPVLFLNATCVAEETLNFAYIDSTTFDETTCAMAAPLEKWWDTATIIWAVFICLTVLIFVVCISTGMARTFLLGKLHLLPSGSLHEEVENMFEKTLVSWDQRKFGKYEKGRYRFVATTVDQDTQTRTVTIVEDMTKKPLSQQERSRKLRVPRVGSSSRGGQVPSAGVQAPRAAAPGTLDTDVPLTNIASLSPSASVTQSEEASAEIDIGMSPPPYKQQGHNFV